MHENRCDQAIRRKQRIRCRILTLAILITRLRCRRGSTGSPQDSFVGRARASRYPDREMGGARLVNGFRWLFDGRRGPRGQMVPRWIFLRALALIYFSAFFSLLFQIKGLIGPEWDSARAGLSGRYRAAIGPRALLVRAVTLLDLVKLDDDDGGDVDRADCVRDCVCERVAAPELLRLLRLLSFVRGRERRVLKLPVGRHVAGGWVSGAVFCAARVCGRDGARTIRLRA